MIAKKEFDSTWMIESIRQFSSEVFTTIQHNSSCSGAQAQLSTDKIITSAIQEIPYEKRKNQLYIRSILQKFCKYEADRLSKTMAKNFGLSEEEFNLIVSQLKTNETAFFERVFLSHFSDCVLYIQKNYSAVYDDAYDATMETMVVFRDRLVANKIKYGNLRYLFTKIATQIFLKGIKAYRSRDLFEDDLEEEHVTVDEDDLKTLQSSWKQLGEGCQRLLKNYYYGKLRLKEIAELEGNTSVNIRKQKERCLQRLKLLFTKQSKN